jgi:hypothetical protein
MNRNFAFHQPVPTQESWWVSADRSSMTQAAREQQDRMGAGRMASFVSPLPRLYVDKRRHVAHVSAFNQPFNQPSLSHLETFLGVDVQEPTTPTEQV